MCRGGVGEEATIPPQCLRYHTTVCIFTLKRIILNIELYYSAIDRHKDGWFLFCFVFRLNFLIVRWQRCKYRVV